MQGMQEVTCKKHARGFLKYLGYEELKIISDTKNSRRGSTQGSLYLLLEIYFSFLKLTGAQKSWIPFYNKRKDKGQARWFCDQTQIPDILNMPNHTHVKPNTKHQTPRTSSGRFSSVWALGTSAKCGRKSWLARSWVPHLQFTVDCTLQGLLFHFLSGFLRSNTFEFAYNDIQKDTVN